MNVSPFLVQFYRFKKIFTNLKIVLKIAPAPGHFRRARGLTFAPRGKTAALLAIVLVLPVPTLKEIIL